MNEFRHRKSSSLLTLFQILEYVSAQSSHESNSRIRALSILLYSSTITSDAQSKTETKSFEHEIFLIVRSSNSQLLFWFEAHSSTNYLLLVLISAFLLDRIEMTWKITIVVIFAFDRLELIETSAKIDWRIFFSVIFWSNRLNLLKFRWCYDKSLLWTRRIAEIILTRSRICCLFWASIFTRRNLVESKWCKRDAFKSVLRRRWKIWKSRILKSRLSICFTLYVKFYLFLNIRSRTRFTEISLCL